MENNNVPSQMLARVHLFRLRCPGGLCCAIPQRLTLATLLFGQEVFAANPPPVQTFYVPLPEDQVFDALAKIYPGNVTCGDFAPEVRSPIHTYISIAAIANGTVLYYDHWEDGFEDDISNPTQTTTEIWGDGDPTNGYPPGFPGDTIEAGNVIVLANPVYTHTLQSVIDFDGGDKFASSKTAAVTRAAWATGSETLLAGAVKVYDTHNWGTRFQVPVGKDIDSNSMFEHTSFVTSKPSWNGAANLDGLAKPSWHKPS